MSTRQSTIYLRDEFGASSGTRTHSCTGFKAVAFADFATEALMVLHTGIEPARCSQSGYSRDVISITRTPVLWSINSWQFLSPGLQYCQPLPSRATVRSPGFEPVYSFL